MKVYVLLCEIFSSCSLEFSKKEIIGVFKNREDAVAKGRELYDVDEENLDYNTQYWCKEYELQ